MHEIEITEIPPLEPNQQSLVAMHSLLNIFNVLRGELALIGITLAGNDALLVRSLAMCDVLTESLRDPAEGVGSARQIGLHTALILAEVEAKVASFPAKRDDPEIAESLANLRSVFAILAVRARELLARAHRPDHWEEYSVAELQQNFLTMFASLEKNSHGRFHFTYNAALQQPCDYYIDFKIEGTMGDRLRMPAVFQDVLRDLIANARKYTALGGHITAALYQDQSELRIVVEDNGRGIPVEELATVTHFGRRASNVGDVRTMGGGFGLTKAFLATKQFGGRFWIASQVGVGTRVRLQIPQAGELAA